MVPAIVGALPAVLGSVVGGSATVASARITQKSQSRRELIGAEIRKREFLYAEFIVETSKFFIDAFDHTLDQPEKLFEVYALQNRIRLTSSEAVISAADQTLQKMIGQYLEPNITQEDFHEAALSLKNGLVKRDDPLKSFAEICRKELQDLQRTAAA